MKLWSDPVELFIRLFVNLFIIHGILLVSPEKIYRITCQAPYIFNNLTLWEDQHRKVK